MRVGLSNTVIVFNENEFRVSALDQEEHIRVSLSREAFAFEIKNFLENFDKTFLSKFIWILNSKHSTTHFLEAKKWSSKIKLKQYRTSEETFQIKELHLSLRDLQTLKSLLLNEKLSNTLSLKPKQSPKRAWRPKRNPYKRTGWPWKWYHSLITPQDVHLPAWILIDVLVCKPTCHRGLSKIGLLYARETSPGRSGRTLSRYIYLLRHRVLPHLLVLQRVQGQRSQPSRLPDLGRKSIVLRKP